MHSKKGLLIVLVLAALAVAAASVGVGLAARAPAQKVLVDTYGNVRLRIVESEYVPTADEPRFDSGWHTHPGLAIVQVKSGTFEITQVGCTPTIVGPGQTYIEIPNMRVRALSQGAINWTTTFLLWNTAGSDSALPAVTTASSTSPCP
jgi:hypothetical protein